MATTTVTHPAAAAALNHGRHLLRRLAVSSPTILHAAWVTALVAVCLALCITHSRKPPPSSSSSSKAARRERGASSSTRRRSAPGDEGSSGGVGGSSAKAAATAAAAATATTAAKVSPTPSDVAAKANGRVGETQTAAAAAEGAAVPVTVIDVGTHGPIAPAFPAPDPLPPRRSLSAKHMRLAERLGSRTRSTRWGRDDHDDDDDEDAGGDPAAAAAAAAADEGGTTLWTKTIILGERCRVGDDDDEDGGGGAVVRWRSYWPRQPRSLPMTRSNSFAGVGSRSLQLQGGGGASRPPPAADVPFHLGRTASLPAKDEL
uniref:Uncharacterized protein n=1 Tax=Oryza glaberrima TaxID=4538 RepID=I1NP66_ORYGL